MSGQDALAPRPWRVGRSVGRTVYDAQDRLIGLMDTAELAALVVACVNAYGVPEGVPAEVWALVSKTYNADAQSIWLRSWTKGDAAHRALLARMARTQSGGT